MSETFQPQAPSQDQFLAITKKFREVFGEYEHLTTSEPVLEIIEPGVAWVVQGQHGQTLVSKNMLILDVDHAFGLSALNGRPDSEHLNDLNTCVDENSITAPIRFYRTFAGCRLIVTHQGDPETFLAGLARYGEAVGADDRYLLASRIRKACQARLKPKSPQMRREFLDQDAGHGPRRACRYVGTVNDNGRIPCESIAAQIRFHDEQTEAFNDRKELF